VNFLHGAVVDDFILLVQKEMLDTIICLQSENLPSGVQEGSENIRSRIADAWLKNFLRVTV
jgi:hypothetical protein